MLESRRESSQMTGVDVLVRLGKQAFRVHIGELHEKNPTAELLVGRMALLLLAGEPIPTTYLCRADYGYWTDYTFPAAIMLELELEVQCTQAYADAKVYAQRRKDLGRALQGVTYDTNWTQLLAQITQQHAIEKGALEKFRATDAYKIYARACRATGENQKLKV